MSIDPRQLITVLAIARHGTFSRAAQALNLCQPALSKSVAALEHKLGVRLFERGPKGATLTKAGEVVVLRAEGLQYLLERIETEVSPVTGGGGGSLAFGATPSMMSRLIPQALAETLEDFPSTEVTAIEGTDELLMPALQRGEIDLVFGPIEELDASDTGIEQVFIGPDPVFIAMRNDHVLASCESVDLAMLQDCDWVLPCKGGSFHRFVESLFLARGLPWPRLAVRSNNAGLYLHLIATGSRVGLLTGSQLLGVTGRLVPVPLTGNVARRIGFKRRRNLRLPAPAETMIKRFSAASSQIDELVATARSANLLEI